MTEWKRIFSDRRRCALLLAILLLCLGLLFYQKWCDAFLSDPVGYRAILEEWRDSMPDEIVAALSGQFEVSENETRLRVLAQYIADYPDLNLDEIPRLDEYYAGIYAYGEDETEELLNFLKNVLESEEHETKTNEAADGGTDGSSAHSCSDRSCLCGDKRSH